MIEKDTLIKVTNRNNGHLGYTIPDLNNLHRDFSPGETKTLPFEELQKLSWIRGGEVLLKSYLRIDNEEAVKALLSQVEPEYYYTDKEIEKLLKEGSLEQLEDCLDFAPEGVIESVKEIAIKEEISDIRKRDAIYKKTGLNVTKAIEINHQTEEDTINKEEAKTRRSVPIGKEGEGRRTAAPQKYNIISK